MLTRLKARLKGDVVATTLLTSRLLSRNPDFELLPDEAPIGGGDVPAHSALFRDPVALKNWLIQEWLNRPSEQLIDTISRTFTDKSIAPDVPSNIYSEFQLISALAHEKSLCSGWDELEAAYYACLNGRFERVLINNNLGVAHAKNHECRQALERFSEAIKESLGGGGGLKAPFYNFVFVMQRLEQQRLIFLANYLDMLDYVSNMISQWKNKEISRQELEDYKLIPSERDWDTEKIQRTYKEIASYGHRLKVSEPAEFFASKALFLVPELDLLSSFGNVLDKVDRKAAQQVRHRGLQLAKKGKFFDGITSLEMAGKFDPEMTFRVAEEIEHISNDWRQQENENVLQLLDTEKYDEAIRTLQYMPDQRIRSQQDEELIQDIRKQKHSLLLQRADQLAKQGDAEKAEAKLLYKLLLQENLKPDVKKYVSAMLAELLQ